jgi:hypothetical protein
MLRRVAFAATLSLSLACGLVACATGGGDEPARDAAATPCTPKGYDLHTQFPALGSARPDLPLCTPSCSAVKFDTLYAVDALPSGACAASAPSCQFSAHALCACASERGPVSAYECDCTGGTWRCGIAVAGAGSCPVHDGGVCP